MTELLASKVAIQEEEPQLRTIPAVSTSIIGLVGVAERGPVGEATLLTSWDDYIRLFGGYTTDGELPMAVRGIYRQDPGAYVYVVRTVHYTDITDPLTKTSAAAEIMIQGTSATAASGAVTSTNPAPFNLAPGDTLDIHVDEDGGGFETATFDAAQAIRPGGAGSYPLTIAHGFSIAFDGGDVQPVVYAAGHAAIAAALNDINSQIVGGRAVDNAGNIDFESDTYGTDSIVTLSAEVGTGLADIGHTAGTTTEATSDVADINAVTFAEVVARIAADITTATITVTQETGGEVTFTSDTSGASSSVQVEASSTADTAMGFDNLLHSGSASSLVDTLKAIGKSDGTYAHDLRVVIADATSGEADHFNLQHTDDGGVVFETFPNVQNIDDTASDFVETVVNADANAGGSRYFEYEDQGVGGGLRPDNGTSTPAAGDDGLTSIDDNDFLGDSAGGTGLHALDLVNDLRLVAIPGRATSAVHNGMITYCESDRETSCFAVLDPAAGWTAAQAVTYVETTAALLGLSEFGAIYWPRISVLNPSKTIYGNTDNITVPPAAWVCGVMSRTDRGAPGGQYQPAAGIERGRIFGCLGFETDQVLDIAARNLVYPKRINPISREPGTPRFIDGTRTLKADGPFPSTSERRGVIFIEQSVKSGTVFARHSNNDEDQRARVFRTVYQFIKQQMKLGAFRTKDPSTAFFVDVSDALNPASVQFQNKLIGRVGLATAKPIDWVIFFFSQDTRALLEELGE
jgi:phage tail sheath protein FI